jgi:hypothetical protein
MVSRFWNSFGITLNQETPMGQDRRRAGLENPMAATWTKAARVRRALKAGRPLRKDRDVIPRVAVHEGCILLEKLREAMLDAELPEEDVRAAVVLMVPNYVAERDAVHVLRIPESEDLPALFRRVAAIETSDRVLTLGLGIWQRDRESGSTVGWIQPFLTGQRAANAIVKARKVLVDGEGGSSE